MHSNITLNFIIIALQCIHILHLLSYEFKYYINIIVLYLLKYYIKFNYHCIHILHLFVLHLFKYHINIIVLHCFDLCSIQPTFIQNISVAMILVIKFKNVYLMPS